MLAAQMAAVHMATMTFAGRLAQVENIPQQTSAEGAFNKLARTFTTQMEALKRYRTGGEQKVTVQHVSVSEGGQAIVGNVTQGPRETARDKIPASPPAITDARMQPMAIVGERAPHGKKRCRMHGSAPGSGAPRGNQNARKHGLFTKIAIEERRQARALVRQSLKLLQIIK